MAIREPLPLLPPPSETALQCWHSLNHKAEFIMHSNYICTHIPSSILHQEDTNCGLMLFFPLQMQKLYSIHNTTVPINREGLWSSTGPVLALCASETDLVGSHLLFWMTLITGALLQRSEGACHFVSQFFLFFFISFSFFLPSVFQGNISHQVT